MATRPLEVNEQPAVKRIKIEKLNLNSTMFEARNLDFEAKPITTPVNTSAFGMERIANSIESRTAYIAMLNKLQLEHTGNLSYYAEEYYDGNEHYRPGHVPVHDDGYNSA